MRPRLARALLLSAAILPFFARNGHAADPSILLRAEEVVYNSDTKIVTAEGHVEIDDAGSAEEALERTLLIEGPTLLFPFARRIVADAIRDGGLPPLLLAPNDFPRLYQAKQAELQQARGGTQPQTV